MAKKKDEDKKPYSEKESVWGWIVIAATLFLFGAFLGLGFGTDWNYGCKDEVCEQCCEKINISCLDEGWVLYNLTNDGRIINLSVLGNPNQCFDLNWPQMRVELENEEYEAIDFWFNTTIEKRCRE